MIYMEKGNITGMAKLVEAEKIARKNARPEPIYTNKRDLMPRLEIPTKAEIVNLKKNYGIRYLAEAGE